MSVKPESIDQDAWDDACEAMNRVGWHMTSVRIACAQAIMAAKAEEREACAAYHDDMAAYHEACREDSSGEAIDHHGKMARSHLASANIIRNRGRA